MENEKRMEFKKAAKIVILSMVMLAITGITAVEATTFSVEDCPDCPDSEIALASGLDYTSYLRCVYRSFDIPSIKKAYGTIDVFEYNDSAKVKTSFKNIRLIYAGKEDKLSDNEIEIAFYDVFEEEKYIRFFGYFLHIEKNILIEVYMGIDTLGCPSAKDIEEAKTRFDAFAKCAHSITGWGDAEAKEEYTLTLEHYPPYYEPKKDEPWRAGDLVATLTDEDGEGVSSKTVFFYVEPGTNLKGVLEYPLSSPNEWIRIRHNFPGVSYIGYAYMHKGVARWNYIYNRCITQDVLTKRFRETGENIKGPISAVVYDEKTDKIGQRASVNIELSSVAKITEISVFGEFKEGESEERKIRVMKVGGGTIPVYDKDYIPQGKLSEIAKCTPYHLFYGDAILFDKNDFVNVIWSTGEKMQICPKPDVFEEEEIHLEKLTIGPFDFDGEINRKIYECTQDSWFSTVILGGLGLCSAHYSPSLGVSSIVIALTGKYFEEVPYVIMRSKSKILVDPTSSGVTFYTVEGSNELITPKGFKRNVTTGHKISVLPDGTFSQVSKFDRSELSDELSYLLDEIEGKPHKPRPILTPTPSTPTPVTPSVGFVHNIDSGEDFLRIQDAVDDSDTKSGDTITVDPGIYVESVLVYKELTIQSVDGMNSTTVHGNGTHAFNITTDRVKISGFSIGSGGRCGIRVADANDCIISDNAVSDSYQGIYILNSNRNMISGNSVWSNDMCGIVLTKSSYNEIRNNNVNFNDARGIGIWHGNENRITDNVMEENTKQGIYVYNSSKNKINDNILSGCPNRSGIELSRSDDNVIRNNTANANNHHGIGLWTSDRNIVANNTVKDNKLNAIYVRESEHNVITYNGVSGSVDWYGIFIHLSDNNEIENNVVSSNNMDGVKFKDSDENTLADNAIKDNGGFGIYLENASINNVFLNDVFDNTKGTADFINASTIWSSTSEIDYT